MFIGLKEKKKKKEIVKEKEKNATYHDFLIFQNCFQNGFSFKDSELISFCVHWLKKKKEIVKKKQKSASYHDFLIFQYCFQNVFSFRVLKARDL